MKRKPGTSPSSLCRSVLCLLAWTAVGASTTPGQATHPRRPAAAHHTPPAEIKNIFWQPNQLTQGSVAFFTAEFDSTPLKVTGTWAGKTLTFFRSTTDPRVWNALAGDDLETQPSSYDLKVTAMMPAGEVEASTKPIDIGAGNFKTGAVDVPENFVEPDAAGKKQIAADAVLKARAYAHNTPRPLWSGNFVKPVDGPSTDTFGESRILNEEKSSTHRGTDFPVKEGTPVRASNSGTVVLAKDLFYEGGCVIIDHGERFFTIYMHLSRIDVHPGENLPSGAKLGLSGATGRVTGPHMHMGVRWNGAYLDPVQLLALTLPKTQAASDEKAPARHRAAPHRTD